MNHIMEAQSANGNPNRNQSDNIMLAASVVRGLVAIGSLSTLSIVTTSLLLLFFLCRLVLHIKHQFKWLSSTSDHFLISNLVLSQFLRALAFVISLHWSLAGNISYPSNWCNAQAGLLQTGDLASGAFALAIAVRGLLITVKGREGSRLCLFAAAVAIWVVVVVLVAAGFARRGPGYFAPGAGDWCEIAQNYQVERLWTHFFWVFVEVVGSRSQFDVDTTNPSSTVWHYLPRNYGLHPLVQ